MGFMRSVLGWAEAIGFQRARASAESTRYSLQTIEVPGDFEFLAKGTSFRQDAIMNLGIGSHKFVLTPERGNTHDNLAVMVQGIKGSETLHVGYLPMGSETQAAAHALGLEMIAKGVILTVDGKVQQGDSGLVVLISIPSIETFSELLRNYS